MPSSHTYSDMAVAAILEIQCKSCIETIKRDNIFLNTVEQLRTVKYVLVTGLKQYGRILFYFYTML